MKIYKIALVALPLALAACSESSDEQAAVDTAKEATTADKLGPGLVVNGILKEHWGRARPRDVTQFGGDRRFTPALVIADQCERNCSFSAGHPSAGFALAALAYASISRRRRWAAA